MKVGSLFSGIGLMDFGLEQAGMETVWQVEYDDWRREVALPQNFSNTKKFKDVKEVGSHNLSTVDLICGGFPCQDISVANIAGKGLDGERSGLWSEFARIIRELRPRYVLIENVANLINRGLDRVLCDLAASGYDAEWQTLRASSFGLPHRRKRLFIVAYPTSNRPLSVSVFSRHHLQKLFTPRSVWNGTVLHLKDLQYHYVEIPEHLRMDDGRTFELSDIKRAVEGYGNGVAIPVAKWLAEQILRFDGETR